MFSELVSNTVMTLGVYASNLKIAKDYIYSDDFLQKIEEIVKSNYK